jgi:hypothetical protein
MIRFFVFYCLLSTVISCKQKDNTAKSLTYPSEENALIIESLEIFNLPSRNAEEKIDDIKLFKDNPEFVSNGFDFSTGKPHAHGCYNAQKLKVNNHLGDDWNGISVGNSDLGDSIYTLANGYISEVKDYKGGWGKVARIVHLHDKKLYES